MIEVPKYIDIDYDELCDNGLAINAIRLDVPYRGKGLFKKFLNDLMEEYSFITLVCWPTLIPMYKHLGFEEVGMEYDGYMGMIRKK